MATNTSHYNLVKPAYTEPADIGVINGDMDLIDSALHDHDIALEEVESSIAIVATGNTHAAITFGQYVYVKEHTALADGLYTASTNIVANATLSSSNLTAVSGGGMNALKASVDMLNGKITNIDSGNTWTNVTQFTPSTGESYAAYNNCWYRVHGSHIVQIHLGLKSLTANTKQDVFTLPSSVPRPLAAIFAVGSGGSTYTAIARVTISTNNVISIVSDDTYCLADFMYYAL